MPRRLPGIRFEAQPSEDQGVLPRMDVAAFIGFAASGPLHTPVLIEDPAQLTGIFGSDANLAWDAGRGDWARAQLAPAVRAFFRNGGRRCWVVRVADKHAAQTNTLPMTGILEALERPSGLTLRPALAWARSEGSWADGTQVRTGLTVAAQPLLNIAHGDGPDELRLQLVSQPTEGDLLRLHYVEAGLTAFVAVERVGPEAGVARGRAVWFAPHGVGASPPNGNLQATWWNGPSPQSKAVEIVQGVDADTVRLTFDAPADNGPRRGSLLRLDPASVWIIADDPIELQSGQLEVSGPASRWLSPPPALPDRVIPVCETLSLELRVGRPPFSTVALDDLDFVPAAPRYWAALPTDTELYAVNQLGA